MRGSTLIITDIGAGDLEQTSTHSLKDLFASIPVVVRFPAEAWMPVGRIVFDQQVQPGDCSSFSANQPDVAPLHSDGGRTRALPVGMRLPHDVVIARLYVWVDDTRWPWRIFLRRFMAFRGAMT